MAFGFQKTVKELQGRKKAIGMPAVSLNYISPLADLIVFFLWFPVAVVDERGARNLQGLKCPDLDPWKKK